MAGTAKAVPAAQTLRQASMELWPINQVKAPLENSLSKIPSSYSLETSRAAEALQHIEDEGIDANPNWNQ